MSYYTFILHIWEDIEMLYPILQQLLILISHLRRQNIHCLRQFRSVEIRCKMLFYCWKGSENNYIFFTNLIYSPFFVTVPNPELSKTLVSRLRLRLAWSQSRSQALRPTLYTLSISLNSWDQSDESQSKALKLRPKRKLVSYFDTINQKSRSQSQTKIKSLRLNN